MLKPAFACLLFMTYPFAAQSATLYANPSNFATVFAAAQSGDTVVATGTFGSLTVANRNFPTRVTLDATNAVFTDTFTVHNVTGLLIMRGTFGSRTAPLRTGRTVAINLSSGIKFQNSTFIGDGATAPNTLNWGMTVKDSTWVQISVGNFSNFRTGMGVTSSSNVKIDNSKFVEMTSDGIQISDSHKVTASVNTCMRTKPHPGAHPDCIQLWSVLGKPVQSDIILQNNVARDATQGFVSFNPEFGGGLRISMLSNTVATSFPQGIACYGCVDSIFTNNIISTLPGSLNQTSISIVGGSNNLIANNSIAPYVKAVSNLIDPLDTLPIDQYSDSIDPIDQALMDDTGFTTYGFSEQFASFDDRYDEDSVFGRYNVLSEAVPEVAIWAQLLIGFGLVGVSVRRRARMTLQ